MADAPNGDEIDRLDETLVAHDSRSGNERDISDDEINTLLAELAKKTDNIVVILDSCHSGSATRLALAEGTARQVPPDTRPVAAEPADSPYAGTRATPDGRTDFRQRGANFVLISGSRPEELSNEGLLGGQIDGALTYALVNALRTGSSRLTYDDLMLTVGEEVTARFQTQHPILEGPGLNTLIFGTERVTTQPTLAVRPSGTEVEIDGGPEVGLARLR
jgi:hypothetical protein